MKNLYILIVLLFSIGLSAQRTHIVTKASSDWCPRCGTWGWDYFEGLKENFSGSGPVLLLSAHKGGSALENPASLWYNDNLDAPGQPRFFINHELIDVTSNTWEADVDLHTTELNQLVTDFSDGGLSFNGIELNGSLADVTVNFDNEVVASGEHRLALYIYENNAEGWQSGRDDAMHVNLMRGSFGDPAGQLLTGSGNYTFAATLNSEWKREDLGMVAVLYWQEAPGDQWQMIDATAVSHFTLKSNDEELIDGHLIRYADRADGLLISMSDARDYELSLYTMSGQQVLTRNFSQRLLISKNDVTSGMYVASFRSGNRVLSQQIFIK